VHQVELQAEQDRAADLRVAPDEVLGVRPERRAVLVVPALLGDARESDVLMPEACGDVDGVELRRRG
jgi:hypothetical protein